MLNLELGSPEITSDGRRCIATKPGSLGYAVYGPYDQLATGDYVVGFSIEAAGGVTPGPRALLAVIDVSSNAGNNVLARRKVYGADLLSGEREYTIAFRTMARCRAEYRVWVSGKAPLLIEDNHPAVAISGGTDAEIKRAITRFPGQAGADIPFFVEHQAALRALFDRGVLVRIEEGSVQLVVSGIVLHARCADDLRFIGEVFFENAYNFSTGDLSCVIDIGMNIGLATLYLADKSRVREVHSFEPFSETFSRAVANINLNPSLATKVTTYNFGLSDSDYDGTILVENHGDSGAMTTVGVGGGTGVRLSLRDAGSVLRPIIDDAEARGLEVVLKVDCEGSEFAIFQSLQRAGLLERIRAFLVEWHTLFEDKDQETLISPLREAGYFVFDRSPPKGNGFFYAVRINSAKVHDRRLPE